MTNQFKLFKANAKTFSVACALSLLAVPSVYADNQNSSKHQPPPLPEVITSFSLGSGPGAMPWFLNSTVHPDRIYVNLRGDGAIAVVNGKTHAQVATITGDQNIFGDPAPVAIDEEHNKLYLSTLSLDGTSAGLVEIDLKTNMIVRSADLGASGGIPVGIYLNHKTHKLYMPLFYGSANGVVVIDQKTLATNKTITMDAYLLAINEKTNKIYVSGEAELDGLITVIDGAHDEIVKTIQAGTTDSPRFCHENQTLCATTGSNLEDLAVNEKTNKIYVTAMGDNTVIEIDGHTDMVSRLLPSGAGPRDIAIDTETNTLYTADFLGASVSMIDAESGKLIGSVPVGTSAMPTGCTLDGYIRPKCDSFGSRTVGVALDSQTGEIYATNAVDGNVVVLRGKRDGEHGRDVLGHHDSNAFDGFGRIHIDSHRK